MKIMLIVHGVVQGVGYRNLVRSAANRHGITGFVRNVRDGSVEIVAVGGQEAIRDFENEIKVNDRYGPQVMHIEKKEHESADSEFDGFKIEHDKKL